MRFELVILLGFALAVSASAQTLQVTYGSKGVQTISFAGMTLEDVGAHGGDAFHIWHMKATDLQGKVASGGQYGWGESNNGEAWNSATNTETYSFGWGSISTQFVQVGNSLNMIVTETNNAGSGIVFDGAEIYPFALHFPIDPYGFSGYSQYAITTRGPGVSVADFGYGMVTSVIPNETVAMYGGWLNTGGNTYTPVMTSTSPDSLATFLPHSDLPVQPGSSFTYTVSIRFTPEGTSADASDAYTSFAATYPSQMTWTDKRIIGTAYLASAPPGNGDVSQPGGFPTNPRRYFNDPSVDITNPSGLQAFQARMLAQAASNVTNSEALGSQGVITWDIEGEQFPQYTSYVCSPDQIATAAPEMESMITDSGSPYYGQKLDDAYFKTMTSAGLKVGVCLRPQVFLVRPDGTAIQYFLDTNAAVVANLENKAKLAFSRWGVTIFYVDSTVANDGGTLDPAIFQQLITDLPNFLFIPEESTPRYYAYSAPFYSFLFGNQLGTPAATYKFYPKAFGANLINDASASTLATYQPQLTQSVVAGDILMGFADYWQANDPTLVAIYQAAAAITGPGSPPNQTTPVITWPTPAAIVYGTTLSAAQLDAFASTPGSFVYNPSAGTLLGAGATTLLATFTPTDSKNYSSATASVAVNVTPATPAITWPAPASIVSGSALGGAQLNASASVAGTFNYTPGAGTILIPGSYTLNVTFTPNDATDYTSSTASVNLTVTKAAQTTPVITWATPASITYGTALSGVQLNASANVAGTFSYTPGAGTVLNPGSYTLNVTFTPNDATDYTSSTASVNLTVTKAVQTTPVIAWAMPASIPYGTALSGVQLNASANVGGSFAYTPGAGTVLAAGTQTLTVLFTPDDTTNYTTQSASVTLNVTSVATSSSTLAILSPGAGSVISGSIVIQAQCLLALDPAGSYLMVDGVEVGSHRVSGGPYVYPLDTTTISNGPHVLQLWGHDIGNNTTVSAGVPVIVSN